jgi:excinuclease ABC subunit C
MKLKVKKFPKTRKTVKNLPESPGVYIFWLNKSNPSYIGKAVNLKSRVSSYFTKAVNAKTKEMVDVSKYLSFIRVNSELESLLLEAKLIKSYKPKYNVDLKDDKNPLYIRITKEKYPRVLTARKIDERQKNIAFFGPFPSSSTVKQVLKMLRRVFPYSTHKLGKRACIYKQLNLCNPCPNEIEKTKDKDLQKKLRKEYLQNIHLLKGILSGRFVFVRKKLVSQMNKYSKSEKFEKAATFRNKIEALDYITQPITDVKEFLDNPNFREDIKHKELEELKGILNNFMDIEKIKRIECFDVAHLAGSYTTASMVTFINAEPEKKYYRHFRIRKVKRSDDISSLDEVIKRRVKHLKDWGRPDLVVVDGGKAQVKTFYQTLKSKKIPVVGIAKRFETLVFITKTDSKIKYNQLKVPKGPALNLLQRLRDEAHRFARRYHHKLLQRELLKESK